MAIDVEPFDWEKEYGALYRACPSAFWLAPEPGDRKPDKIDVRKDRAQNVSALAYLNDLQSLQNQHQLQAANVSALAYLNGLQSLQNQHPLQQAANSRISPYDTYSIGNYVTCSPLGTRFFW